MKSLCSICIIIKNRIRLFCLNNPDKMSIPTGDTKQLPCFEEHTDCQDEEEYANHCMDMICPYKFTWPFVKGLVIKIVMKELGIEKSSVIFMMTSGFKNCL